MEQNLNNDESVEIVTEEKKGRFTIDFLYRFWIDGGYDTPVNPCTKKKLEKSLSSKIRKYGEDKERCFNLIILNHQDPKKCSIYTISMPYYKCVGSLILLIIKKLRENKITTREVLSMNYKWIPCDLWRLKNMCDSNILSSIYDQDMESTLPENVNGQNIICTSFKDIEDRNKSLMKLKDYLDSFLLINENRQHIPLRAHLMLSDINENLRGPDNRYLVGGKFVVVLEIPKSGYEKTFIVQNDITYGELLSKCYFEYGADYGIKKSCSLVCMIPYFSCFFSKQCIRNNITFPPFDRLVSEDLNDNVNETFVRNINIILTSPETIKELKFLLESLCSLEEEIYNLTASIAVRRLKDESLITSISKILVE